MNLPNKLTMIRIGMIPFVIGALMIDSIPHNRYIALIIFALACITDFLDGYIARKHNLITNLGKFLDPIADKILVILTLVALVELGRENIWWVLALIIARELAISGFRIIAAEKKVVIAANYYGKLKTNFQMLWIIMLILPFEGIYYYNIATNVVMYLTAILTVVSFVVYIVQNKKVLDE